LGLVIVFCPHECAEPKDKPALGQYAQVRALRLHSATGPGQGKALHRPTSRLLHDK
jgi:hypothetical protein